MNMNDNSLSWKSSKALGQKVKLTKIHKRNISMLDQFHVNLHPYILDIVDVKANDHCGYLLVVVLLDKGEDSWLIVRNNFLKKLGQWWDEYAIIFGSYECYDVIKRSLLVDKLSMVKSIISCCYLHALIFFCKYANKNDIKHTNLFIRIKQLTKMKS